MHSEKGIGSPEVRAAGVRKMLLRWRQRKLSVKWHQAKPLIADNSKNHFAMEMIAEVINVCNTLKVNATTTI
jgi:hypothetical protein